MWSSSHVFLKNSLNRAERNKGRRRLEPTWKKHSALTQIKNLFNRGNVVFICYICVATQSSRVTMALSCFVVLLIAKYFTQWSILDKIYT